MDDYHVTVWLNADRDGMVSGYAPHHALATDVDLKLCLRMQASPHGAAEAAWVVGNRMAPDSLGHSWPTDVRSMSVGDVAELLDAKGTQSLGYWSVDSFGFTALGQRISNRRVALNGNYRLTGRPADTTHTPMVVPMDGGWRAVCSCGWWGVHHSDASGRGHTLATRLSEEDGRAHVSGMRQVQVRYQVRGPHPGGRYARWSVVDTADRDIALGHYPTREAARDDARYMNMNQEAW